MNLEIGKWWRGEIAVRGMILLMVTLSFLVFNVRLVVASWMIDPARFHASVHGQTSCQECHENISPPGGKPSGRWPRSPATWS